MKTKSKKDIQRRELELAARFFAYLPRPNVGRRNARTRYWLQAYHGYVRPASISLRHVAGPVYRLYVETGCRSAPLTLGFQCPRRLLVQQGYRLDFLDTVNLEACEHPSPTLMRWLMAYADRAPEEVNVRCFPTVPQGIFAETHTHYLRTVAVTEYYGVKLAGTKT